MKDIKAVKGKYFVARLIEEGEHEHQDFKHSVSDPSKIAHSISAFANNSGGRLLIGVKDNGSIAGVKNDEDIYVVEQAAESFCRPPQKVEFKAYHVEGGAVVISAEVAEAATRPVFAREADNSWKAYYRVADENVAAHPLMVKMWRRKYGDSPGGTVVGDLHRRFLKSVADSGIQTFTLEEAAVAAGLSLAAAEKVAIDLAVLDMIGFTRVNGRFLLTLV